MKTTLSIIVCKLVALACKIAHKNGTVYPGSIANKIDEKVLDKLKYPEKVIVVTGSSGKGSTSGLLAHIYKEAGKKVIWNDDESNVKNAVLTTILKNTNAFTHKINGDVIILEADERFLSKLFRKGIITDLILTNVTRDQPTRNIHTDIVYNAIIEAISDDIHLYINADDPIVSRVKLFHKGKITTYGISDTNYSSETHPLYALDTEYCPKCNSKLDYSLYHYGNFGIYKCTSCDFERGHIDYDVTNADLDKSMITVNGNDYSLNFGVYFAIYYTVAAIACAKETGISDEILDKALNKNKFHTHRFKEYDLLDRKVIMIDSKTENAPSFIQSVEYIKRQPGKKSMIMGFNSVSRRYSANDLSWLWDIPYEIFNDDTVDKIYCIGRFRYDMAVRIAFAGIPKEKIRIIDDLENLIDDVTINSEGNIYTTFYYDLASKVVELINKKNEEEHE